MVTTLFSKKHRSTIAGQICNKGQCDCNLWVARGPRKYPIVASPCLIATTMNRCRVPSSALVQLLHFQALSPCDYVFLTGSAEQT